MTDRVDCRVPQPQQRVGELQLAAGAQPEALEVAEAGCDALLDYDPPTNGGQNQRVEAIETRAQARPTCANTAGPAIASIGLDSELVGGMDWIVSGDRYARSVVVWQ